MGALRASSGTASGADNSFGATFASTSGGRIPRIVLCRKLRRHRPEPFSSALVHGHYPAAAGSQPSAGTPTRPRKVLSRVLIDLKTRSL